MTKDIFDRLVEEYKKEPFEEIIGRLIAAQNIECRDREFANQCEVGETFYNLSDFFAKVKKLCNAEGEVDTINALIDVKACFNNAKESYTSVVDELRSINNCSRIGQEEESVIGRIKLAKNPNDRI